MAPLGGGPATRLTFDSVEMGALAWMPDGKTIVFASSRRGSRTLWAIAAGGGEPQPLTSGAGEDDYPSLSADGRTLVYTNVRPSWGLMARDPATGRDPADRRGAISVHLCDWLARWRADRLLPPYVGGGPCLRRSPGRHGSAPGDDHERDAQRDAAVVGGRAVSLLPADTAGARRSTDPGARRRAGDAGELGAARVPAGEPRWLAHRAAWISRAHP